MIRESLDSDKLIKRFRRHQVVHNFDDYDTFYFDLVEAPDSPERILVIQPSSIGDVLYITPALNRLRQRHPEATIGYVVEQDAADILTGGVPDELIVAHKNVWEDKGFEALDSIRNFINRLQEFEPDVILNTHNTARAALYAGLAETPDSKTIGMSFRDLDTPQLTGNLYHFIRFTQQSQENLLAPPGQCSLRPYAPGKLARWMGVGYCKPEIDITITESVQQQALSALEQAGWNDGQSSLAIHTGSRREHQRYKRQKWPTLIELIDQHLEHQIVFIGGPSDVERHNWIADRVDVPLTDVTDQGSLRFSAAVLEQCDLLVGPDTSTTHLAAAVGCPSVSLSGPRWVGGFNKRNLVVSGPEQPSWSDLLEPEEIVRAMKFVLDPDQPNFDPPNQFTSSWTGLKFPQEFFREQHPHRIRKGDEWTEAFLSLAWENLVSTICVEWGYPGRTINSDDVVEWLGTPDQSAVNRLQALNASLSEFQTYCRKLTQKFKILQQGSSLPRNLQTIDQPDSPFWEKFFSPVHYHRSVYTMDQKRQQNQEYVHQTASLSKDTQLFLSAFI